MKRLKTISLYKITLVFFLFFYTNNYLFLILGLIYLFIHKYDNCIVLIFLIVLSILLNQLNFEIIRFGIIDYKKGNNYIVESLLYKTSLKTEDELLPGDIIIYEDNSSSPGNLKQNIRFNYNTYRKIGSFNIRKFIYKHLANYNENINDILTIIINGQNEEYDYDKQLLFGLIIYYLLNDIYKRNKALTFILMLIYSLFFIFQIKFILLILKAIVDRFEIDKKDKLSIILLLIFFYNKKLLNNYAFLIPIFFNILSILDLRYKNIFYFMILQSILFGSINIINTILFSYLLKLRKLIFILALIILIFPGLTNIFIYLIDFFLKLINTNRFAIRGSLSIYGLLILVLMCLFNEKNNIIACLILILILLCPLNYMHTNVTFIDVGQGDSILINESFNRSNILLDTGSIFNYSKLRKTLFKKGIYKLDYLIISHDDSDHNGNIDSLLKDFEINEIVTQAKDIEVNDFYFKNYYLGEFDNDNDNSLIYELNIDNYSFLFTGDLSKEGERILVDKYLGNNDHYDFLKVGHHGSNTSSSDYFISSILPKYAIISTSGMYNHPHKETINILKKYLVRTFNTKYDGNIEVYFTKAIDFIKTRGGFVIIG